MNTLWLILALLLVVLWPLESWFIVRLGRAHHDSLAKLGWVPFLRTIVVARTAGVGWLSWLLSFVPLVGLYVNWDWWDEIFDAMGIRYSGLRALGMFVPGLRTYLMYRAARAAEARFRPSPAPPLAPAARP